MALDVFDEIEARVEAAIAAASSAVASSSIPASASPAQPENIALLRALPLFTGWAARFSSFLQGLIGGEQRPDAKERLPGSLAAAMHALDQGADPARP
jgi:hypothetical protein